jgi:hypothetical protein
VAVGVHLLPSEDRVPKKTKSIKLTALAGAGILAVAAGPATVAAASGHGDSDHGAATHVLVLSVDGLHQADLAAYIDKHPGSALAALVAAGTQYTHAQTTFPSDSFPGLVAQFTGGAPATTGVFYDDSYNHELLPAGTLDCRTASAGAEVAYAEGADRSQKPIRLDAGQQLAAPTLTALPTNTLAQTLALADPALGEPGPLARAILGMTSTPQTLLDPATLPIDPASCQPVYPHSYLKVNTVFEVARSAGLGTAWSDKHPAYEIVNGPSGAGVQDLFTPEINSVADAAGDDFTKDNRLTQAYDSIKVDAVLNEIAGKDHAGTRQLGTPAVFGMNFQTVSTAQKLPVSDGLAGGYLPDGTPGPLLAKALDYIDAQVGAMRTAIHRRGLDGSTSIILSAKHGQSPIDRSALRRVDDGAILAAINGQWQSAHPGAAPLVAHSADDDGMLLWLSDRSPAALDLVKDYLLAHSAPANRDGDPKGTSVTSVPTSGLSAVYTGTDADAYLHAKAGDPRVPDVIGLAQDGVVYTGGTAKIAEHGGNHPQDRDVALVVAGAGVAAHSVNTALVQTTQIAPSILALLGLDPQDLQAVRTDHTPVLPGL